MTLHSWRVIHRDLKPENVLLDSNYRPSIIDFGLSKVLDNSSSNSFNPCGTLSYMATEIFDGNHYSTKSDVYSFGILMFEVLTGKQAYDKRIDKKSFIKFANDVCKGQRPVFETPIKSSFEQLIQQCLSSNPRERPLFRDLYHKWSLVLEGDDEATESSNPEQREEEEEENSKDEHGYFRYFLDEVDVDKVLYYFEELSDVQLLKIAEQEKRIESLIQEITSIKQQQQQEIAEKINYIKEFQQNQSTNERQIKLMTSFNSEISSLRNIFTERQNQISTALNGS